MLLPALLLSLLITTTLTHASSSDTSSSPTTTTPPPSPASGEEHQDEQDAAHSQQQQQQHRQRQQNKAKRQLYHLTYDHPDPYQDETTFYASKQLQQAAAAAAPPQVQQTPGLGASRQQPTSPVYQLRTNYLNIVPPHAGVQKPQVYTQQSSQLPSIVVPVTQQPLRQLPKFHYQLPAATYKPLTYYNLQQYHAPTAYQKMDGPPKPIALESQNSCGEKTNSGQPHLQPQQQVVEEQFEQSPPGEYPAAMLVNLGASQLPKSEALVQQGPHLAPIHVYQTSNGQYKIAPQLYGGPQLFKQPAQQLVPALRFHYVEHGKKPKPVVVLRKKTNDDEEEEVVPEKKPTKKKYEDAEDNDDGKKQQSSDDDDEDDSKGSYEKSDGRGRNNDDNFKPSKHYPYDEDRKYARKHHKGNSGEFKHYNDDDEDVVKSKSGKFSEKGSRDYRRPNSSNHRGSNNDGDETQNVEVYKDPIPILQKMLPTEIKQKKVYRENWFITKSIQN